MEFAGIQKFTLQTLRSLIKLLAAFESAAELLRSGICFVHFVPKLIHLCLNNIILRDSYTSDWMIFVQFSSP